MRGHIHVRLHRCVDGSVSRSFYVVLDLPRNGAGHRRQKWHGAFPTYDLADQARAQLVSNTSLASALVSSARTLSDWVLDDWLSTAAGRVRPSTLFSYRRNLELHVLPSLGWFRLDELRTHQLNALYARLLSAGGPRGRLSPKTVHYIHTILHKALADAVDAGAASHNPASRAKPPRPHPHIVSAGQVWEADELAVFLQHVENAPLGAVWRLVAMTGLRRGEILGLRWTEVDLHQRRLSIRHTRVVVDGEVIDSTPKAGTARTVDIDARTAAMLKRESPGRESYRRTSSDGLVASERGVPVHPDAFSRLFKRHASAAGLRPIRLHDLRHTHASLLLKAGVPVKVVTERLGHRSAAFTLMVYAHVIPGMQADAAAGFARVVDGILQRVPKRSQRFDASS